MPAEREDGATAVDRGPAGRVLGRHVRLTTEAASPVVTDDFTVTPVARCLNVRLGPSELWFAWPHAVLVSDSGGSSRIPVRNLTRLIQATILVSAGLAAYGLLQRSTSRKERSQ